MRSNFKRMVSLTVLGFNPMLDLRLQHIQRRAAVAQDGVMERPHIESVA